MNKRIRIGKWDIDVDNRARWGWGHLKLHRLDGDRIGRHLVWGKLSVLIEDSTAEVYPICAQCESPEIGEIGNYDESWTVCQDCRSIEQGYTYVSKREMEKRGLL